MIACEVGHENCEIVLPCLFIHIFWAKNKNIGWELNSSVSVCDRNVVL